MSRSAGRASKIGGWVFAAMMAATFVSTPIGADTPPIATAPAPPADVFRNLERMSERRLAPGIVHEQWRSAAPLAIHVLRIDLDEPTVDFEAVPGADNVVTRERPSSVAGRLSTPQRRAVAAINADMGARGRNTPMAMFVRNGELLVSPSRRTVLALAADRRARIASFTMSLRLSGLTTDPIAIESVNRTSELRSAALFTEHFVASEKRDADIVEVLLEADGKLTVPTAQVPVRCLSVTPGTGGTPIEPGTMLLQLSPEAAASAGLQPGGRGLLEMSLDPAIAGLRTACGGVPRLLRDGAVDIPWKEEGVSIETFATARHPRTGAGLDASGRTLILVTTDGRQPAHSMGLTLEEHAELLRQLGAHEACNFDGGGSTTMVIEGVVANSPSDNSGERATTSSLVIFSTAPPPLAGGSGS